MKKLLGLDVISGPLSSEMSGRWLPVCNALRLKWLGSHKDRGVRRLMEICRL